jgi:DNA-binding NarL/FixJ family response regulator
MPFVLRLAQNQIPSCHLEIYFRNHSMISVAIVEGDETVRDSLREWIDSSSNCRCVCACDSVAEALSIIPPHRPEVVVIDLHLSDECGVECIRRLRQWVPGIQVLVFTEEKDHEAILNALKAGACGYLLKRSSREEIIRAIVEVKQGGAPMTGEIARRVLEIFHEPVWPLAPPLLLSPRENEVLALLAQAMSNKQIAAHLGISYETVCVHLRRIYGKLQVRTRTEAVLKHLKAQSPLSERNREPMKSMQARVLE